MKALIVLGTLVLFSLVAGCGSNPSNSSNSTPVSVTVDEVDQKRMNVYYEKGSDTPYTGAVVDYYPSGEKQSSIQVELGLPVRTVGWYRNGQKSREAKRSADKSGYVTEWYENGQMKSTHWVSSGKKQCSAEWDEAGNMQHQSGSGCGEGESAPETSAASSTLHAEVEEALQISGGSKAAVAEYFMGLGKFPADNTTAGLMDGSQIRGKYVSSIVVNSGVISVSFGGDSAAAFAGRALILTPTTQSGRVVWQCSSRDIAPDFLPRECK